jgi:hypothetical protein
MTLSLSRVLSLLVVAAAYVRAWWIPSGFWIVTFVSERSRVRIFVGPRPESMLRDRVQIGRLWFYGTLLYCLVVAVLAGFRGAHSGGALMPPLVRVFFAPAMLSFGAQAIYAGRVRGRWGAPITRDNNPVAFWISVGAYLAISCYLLLTGLRVAAL